LSEDTRPLLWLETRYGMSEAALRAAIPNARRSAHAEPLRNGARALLALDDVELLDRHFAARFYFLNQALHQVTLGMTPTPTRSAGASAFQEFRTALRIKYGTEVDSRSVTNERGTIQAATWLHGPTNIELVFMSIDGEPEYFNVVYQARLSSEAAKL
jgi:hypothetical protein